MGKDFRNPRHYHGKRFFWLEQELEKEFLNPQYGDDLPGGQNSISLLYLTRDRLVNGQFVSGLQQAKRFSERSEEGMIYVFNGGVTRLRGYKDDGERNIIIAEPINLRKYLEFVVLNCKLDAREAGEKMMEMQRKAEEFLKRGKYQGIKVLTFN